MVAVAVAPLAILVTALLTADTTGIAWLDTVSKLGLVGYLALTLYGLAKKWWVPGWVYRDLEARHDRLRARFDKLVETALTSSRGVERTATLVEAALERAADKGQ